MHHTCNLMNILAVLIPHAPTYKLSLAGGGFHRTPNPIQESNSMIQRSDKRTIDPKRMKTHSELIIKLVPISLINTKREKSQIIRQF